jgi:ComF family protein
MPRWLDMLLQWVYPQACRGCETSFNTRVAGLFCEDCWQQIRRIEGPCCPGCGKPFGSEATLSHSPTHRCGDCRERPRGFDAAFSVCWYDGVLAEAVRLLKYHGKPRLSRPLCEVMSVGLKRLPPIETILPVPLHPKRLREREFNQAALLAKGLRRYTGARLDLLTLHRERWTPPQVELSGPERVKNVRKAFRVVRPERIAGQALLLVDDVYTTGATLEECAKALKKAGAKTVYALTLARTA